MLGQSASCMDPNNAFRMTALDNARMRGTLTYRDKNVREGAARTKRALVVPVADTGALGDVFEIVKLDVTVLKSGASIIMPTTALKHERSGLCVISNGAYGVMELVDCATVGERSVIFVNDPAVALSVGAQPRSSQRAVTFHITSPRFTQCPDLMIDGTFSAFQGIGMGLMDPDIRNKTCTDSNNAFRLNLFGHQKMRGTLMYRNKYVREGVANSLHAIVVPKAGMGVPTDMFEVIKLFTPVLKNGVIENRPLNALRHEQSGKCVKHEVAYGVMALVDCQTVGARNVISITNSPKNA